MVRALRIRGGAGSHRKIFNEAVSRSVFVNVMNIAIKYIYIYIYTHMHRHHGVYRWVKISSSSPRKKNSFLPSFVRELVHFPLLLRPIVLSSPSSLFENSNKSAISCLLACLPPSLASVLRTFLIQHQWNYIFVCFIDLLLGSLFQNRVDHRRLEGDSSVSQSLVSDFFNSILI